jgi:hypothetical protein
VWIGHALYGRMTAASVRARVGRLLASPLRRGV